MKSVYLHIGHFKTGTSAIQKYCSDNRSALLSADFDYLEGARPARSRTNHSLLPLSLYQAYGKSTPEWFVDKVGHKRVLREVRAEIENSNSQAILISSEEFYRLTIFDDATVSAIADELKSLFEGVKVHVIMYVRPPMDFLSSWYNQANKANVPRKRFIDFFADLNETLLTPSVNAAFWRQCFGDDCLQVLPYQHRGQPHIAQFLRAIGAAGAQLPEASAGDINPKIDELELERNRLARVFTMLDKQERGLFLRTQTFTSQEGLNRMRRKMRRINQNYAEFCTAYALPQAQNTITINTLLMAAEKLNRADAQTLSPIPALSNLIKAKITNNALAEKLKEWF